MQEICFVFLLKLVKTFLNGYRMVEDRSEFMAIQCTTPPTSNNKQHRTTNNISFSLRLFLDGDCRVEPTHLKDMFHYLITENLAACGCFLLTEKVALKLKSLGQDLGGNDAKVPTRYLLEKLQNQTQDRKKNNLPPVIIEAENWECLHRTVITFQNMVRFSTEPWLFMGIIPIHSMELVANYLKSDHSNRRVASLPISIFQGRTEGTCC